MKKFIDSLINLLKVATCVIGIGMLIAYFSRIPAFSKPWSYLAAIVLVFVPDFCRLLGLKISKRLELIYLIWFMLAMVLGINFDLYRLCYPLDKIAHSCSGIVAAFVAKEIIDQASAKPDRLWFKVLFTVAFTALTAVVWEIYEFSYDQLFHGHMQQLIVPGLQDTMWDMIVALVGGTITSILIYKRN